MKAALVRSEPLTDSIRTFYFLPERSFSYIAGQYIEMTLLHDKPDERGTRRWFTLSSSAHDELLSITTRLATDKPSSFKRALWAMQAGDDVDISEPQGDFVLPKSLQVPLVFVAGGIGITPFHSILETLAVTEEPRSIRLMYAVAREDDIIFQDTFERAGVHATIVVDQPSRAWGGEQGRLNAEMILGVENPDPDTLFYLSGPEPMIKALRDDLQTRGVPMTQIVTDLFEGYTSI